MKKTSLLAALCAAFGITAAAPSAQLQSLGRWENSLKLYVDDGGASGADGLTPQTAVDTLKAALDLRTQYGWNNLATTINLLPGVYEGAQSLPLRGLALESYAVGASDEVLLSGAAVQALLTFTQAGPAGLPDSIVRGIHFELDVDSNSGVYAQTSADSGGSFEVSDCLFTLAAGNAVSAAGIYFTEGGVELTSPRFIRNRFVCSDESAPTVAIWVRNSDSVLVAENQIEGKWQVGVYVTGNPGDVPRVLSNTIQGGFYGVFVSSCYATILGNTIAFQDRHGGAPNPACICLQDTGSEIVNNILWGAPTSPFTSDFTYQVLSLGQSASIRQEDNHSYLPWGQWSTAPGETFYKDQNNMVVGALPGFVGWTTAGHPHATVDLHLAAGSAMALAGDETEVVPGRFVVGGAGFWRIDAARDIDGAARMRGFRATNGQHRVAKGSDQLADNGSGLSAYAFQDATSRALGRFGDLLPYATGGGSQSFATWLDVSGPPHGSYQIFVGLAYQETIGVALPDREIVVENGALFENSSFLTAGNTMVDFLTPGATFFYSGGVLGPQGTGAFRLDLGAWPAALANEVELVVQVMTYENGAPLLSRQMTQRVVVELNTD